MSCSDVITEEYPRVGSLDIESSSCGENFDDLPLWCPPFDLSGGVASLESFPVEGFSSLPDDDLPSLLLDEDLCSLLLEDVFCSLLLDEILGCSLLAPGGDLRSFGDFRSLVGRPLTVLLLVASLELVLLIALLLPVLELDSGIRGG